MRLLPRRPSVFFAWMLSYSALVLILADNAVARLGGLPPMRDFREPLAELVARLH